MKTKKTILFVMSLAFAAINAQTYTGNVGVNTATPAKNLDVNGTFRSLYTDASAGLTYELSDNKTDIGGNPQILMSVANNPNIAAATEFSYMGVVKGAANIAARNATGASQLIFNPGVSAMSTQTTTGNAQIFLNGSSPYSQLTAGNADNSKLAQVQVDPVSGIKFYVNGITGTTNSTYSFPTESGVNGQIMVLNGNTTSTTGKLQWKNISDVMILKSAGGNCFKVSVSDFGTLSTVAATCP